MKITENSACLGIFQEPASRGTFDNVVVNNVEEELQKRRLSWVGQRGRQNWMPTKQGGKEHYGTDLVKHNLHLVMFFVFALLSSTKTSLLVSIFPTGFLPKLRQLRARLTSLKEELAKAAPDREERASKVMASAFRDLTVHEGSDQLIR